MALTTYTLSGDVADFIDADYDANKLSVVLESSEPIITDGATKVRVGNVRATLTAGAFTFTGIPATVSGSPSYRVVITWTDAGTRKQEKFKTGWFAMTANSDLAVKVLETYTPTVITPTVAAQIAAAAALGATNDTATASFLANPASATTAALRANVAAPDDAGYDLVLLLGQSNMSGRGTPYDTVRYDPSVPRVEQYGASGTYAGVMSTAIEPLAMHDTPSGIGPGLVFARWYVQSIPSARRVLLVPAAHGGTQLSVNTTPLGWRRGVSGNLYAQALAQAQAALAAAGANARIVAALWVQGESDGDSNVTGTAYQTDLDALITGLRTDLGIANLPFIIGQMVPDYLATGTRAAINTVQAATPSRLARVAFSQGVPGQSLGDGNHYNAVAQRLIGRKMYEAYRRVINGTADPAMPSALGTVTGVTATPTNLSAAIAWTALTGAGAYLVEYRVTGAGSWTRGGNTSGTTYTLTGLTALTGYDVRVTAINAAGLGTPSATTTFTSGDVPNVTDSFTRADSTTTLGSTDTGQAWVTDASVWGISGNRATMVSGTNGNAQVECGRANGTFSVKFATAGGGSNHSRLLFRGSDTLNYWTVQGRVAAGVPGKLQLYKWTAGSPAQVSVDSVADWVAGDTISVVCSGSSITVKRNGTTVIGPVTDAYLSTATKHGLAAVANGPLYDDFSATA